MTLYDQQIGAILNMKKYHRFIQDVATFMMNNLTAVENMYFNIYFEDGHYWIKLEPTDYYDLLSRPLAKERILDPVMSFTVGEVNIELFDTIDRMEQSDVLKRYLMTEINPETFELWMEFN